MSGFLFQSAESWVFFTVTWRKFGSLRRTRNLPGRRWNRSRSPPPSPDKQGSPNQSHRCRTSNPSDDIRVGEEPGLCGRPILGERLTRDQPTTIPVIIERFHVSSRLGRIPGLLAGLRIIPCGQERIKRTCGHSNRFRTVDRIGRADRSRGRGRYWCGVEGVVGCYVERGLGRSGPGLPHREGPIHGAHGGVVRLLADLSLPESGIEHRLFDSVLQRSRIRFASVESTRKVPRAAQNVAQLYCEGPGPCKLKLEAIVASTAERVGLFSKNLNRQRPIEASAQHVSLKVELPPVPRREGGSRSIAPNGGWNGQKA